MPLPDAEIRAAEIRAAEAALRAAQLAGDVAALDRLLADELLFTGPDGRLATKADDLAAYRARAVEFVAHEPLDLRVRVVRPDVAVAALLARLTVRLGGVPQPTGTWRYTRVWARDGDGWRVVAGHVAPAPAD